MQDTINQVKGDFSQAKAGLERVFEKTPDDRLNWSPSPSARTPVQLVAHTAWAIGSMHSMLQGQTFAVPTTEEADKEFREFEAGFTTRSQALDLLEKNSAAYLAWLDGLSEEQLNAVITFPFGMGEAPMSFVLPFMSAHVTWHTAQLDYVQTAYGDRVWH